MKRFPLIAAAVISLLWFHAANLFAGEQDFTLINKTGVDIQALYISTSATADWEENLLPGPLAEGESIQIHFDADEEASLWDIMVQDHEGTQLFWNQLNLKDISVVTLTLENGEPQAFVE